MSKIVSTTKPTNQPSITNKCKLPFPHLPFYSLSQALATWWNQWSLRSFRVYLNEETKTISPWRTDLSRPFMTFSILTFPMKEKEFADWYQLGFIPTEKRKEKHLGPFHPYSESKISTLEYWTVQILNKSINLNLLENKYIRILQIPDFSTFRHQIQSLKFNPSFPPNPKSQLPNPNSQIQLPLSPSPSFASSSLIQSNQPPPPQSQIQPSLPSSLIYLSLKLQASLKNIHRTHLKPLSG